MMATNGKFGEPCITKHTAYIYDRGGRTRLDQVYDINQITWNRDRDGVSEAEITLTGRSCSEQAALIRRIASKRHELVIFRGRDRVWEGPIFRVGDAGQTVTIAAKDVLAYLFATPLTKVWSNRFPNITTVTGRFEEIINYELTHSREIRRIGGGSLVAPGWEQLEVPINVLPHLDVRHYPNEAQTTAHTEPYEMTVGEHLQGAARTSGIDFTATGRAIHIWDVSRFLGRTRTLTEKDFFGNVIVTEYGADHTQIAYVVGQDGVYGEAANAEHFDFYGPWTTVYTAYNEEGTEAPGQSELDSQATRNTSGRSPVPFEVRIPDNSSLRLNESLTIRDLVPGVQVPLRATLNARTRDQMQKLDHVTVVETSEKEEIKITLSPATKADEDSEEE